MEYPHHRRQQRFDDMSLETDACFQEHGHAAGSVIPDESRWSSRSSSEISIPSTRITRAASRNGRDQETSETQVSPLKSPRPQATPPADSSIFSSLTATPYQPISISDSSSTLLSGKQPLIVVHEEASKKRTCWQKFWDMEESWSLEIASLVLSVASFCCIVILLLQYDGKSLSSWKGSTLSLNTVVSILAGISKASLALVVSACLGQFKWNWIRTIEAPLIDFDRLDGASRGVWGSCRLLSTMVRRPHWLVIGALTTIILIGFEPFLQGVISFEDRLVVIPANNDTRKDDGTGSAAAMIGSCSRLQAGSYSESTHSVLGGVYFNNSKGEQMLYQAVGGFDLRIDPGMTAAVWNGFSNIVTDQNLWPVFICTSGNCTWARFPSLAICSKCNDISDQIERSKHSYRIPAVTNFGWSSSGDIPPVSNQGLVANLRKSFNSTGTITTYTVPGIGLNISNYDGPSDCKDDTPSCPETYMSTTVTTNPGLTLTFGGLRTMILAVQILESDTSWENNQTLWEDTKVTAAECSLSYCVNFYETRSESGILHEQAITSWANKTPDSFSHRSKDEVEREWEKYVNYTLNNSPGRDWLRSDLQLFIPNDHDGQKPDFAGGTFNITQGAVTSMIRIFSQGFGPLAASSGSAAAANVSQYIYPSLGNVEQPGFIYSLGETRNVTKSFETVARSLTKWMRDRVPKGSYLSGEVRQMVVITRVQWKYLVWPSATLLAGIVFSILAILETKRMKVPAWRNNALAMLANCPGPVLERNLETAVLTKDLAGMARRTGVVFEYRDGLGKIVQREKL